MACVLRRACPATTFGNDRPWRYAKTRGRESPTSAVPSGTTILLSLTSRRSWNRIARRSERIAAGVALRCSPVRHSCATCARVGRGQGAAPPWPRRPRAVLVLETRHRASLCHRGASAPRRGSQSSTLVGGRTQNRIRSPRCIASGPSDCNASQGIRQNRSVPSA